MGMLRRALVVCLEANFEDSPVAVVRNFVIFFDRHLSDLSTFHHFLPLLHFFNGFHRNY
jgi:hypothetical protein